MLKLQLLHIPTYLLSLNVHGPCFITPFKELIFQFKMLKDFLKISKMFHFQIKIFLKSEKVIFRTLFFVKIIQIKIHDVLNNFIENVWDGEFHPNPNFISSATKSEPSDKFTSHKAIPVNEQCNKHYIFVIIIQSHFTFP